MESNSKIILFLRGFSWEHFSYSELCS